MWGVGPAVVVGGGSVSVNTTDLDSLASSLTSAAGSLDDARTLVANAITEVSTAPPPPSPPLQFDPLDSNVFSPPARRWKDVNGQCVPIQESEDLSITPRFLRDEGTDDGVVHSGLDVDLEKSDALQALEALSTGPGSLQDVASALRGIASDVTACSQAHTLAEGAGAASLAGLMADPARRGPCAVVCTGGNADDGELAALADFADSADSADSAVTYMALPC